MRIRHKFPKLNLPSIHEDIRASLTCGVATTYLVAHSHFFSSILSLKIISFFLKANKNGAIHRRLRRPPCFGSHGPRTHRGLLQRRYKQRQPPTRRRYLHDAIPLQPRCPRRLSRFQHPIREIIRREKPGPRYDLIIARHSRAVTVREI